MNISPNDMKRLEARIPAHTKELLERAARLEGRSLTDIVIEAIGAKARQIIQEHEAIDLGRDDQIRLAEALLNPPEATPGQKRAARWYLEERGA